MRRRLPGQTGPTGGQAYSDVLGVLEFCREDTLGVRRADNSLVEIQVADVLRAKRIPPAPTRRGG
ncbi:MAG: hypothetical protein M3400_01875 [Actinomycetota bacterium]|nr:hypothetical protein [Actinomycetota bacterium]